MNGWHPHGAPRRILRWTRWSVWALLLPLALLVALGQWWLLPRLNDYRGALAETLGDYLHLPVRIENVTAAREDWRLGLRLRDVSLQDPRRDATLATFSQAMITLDLWRSLREWRPVLDHVRLEGARLTLEAEVDGMFRLLGATDSAATVLTLPEVAHWLLELPGLEIVGEQLAVRQPGGLSLEFPHPHLQLSGTPTGQRLTFTAELPAERGGRIELMIERRRDQTADPEPEQGRFEFRVDRLNLAGWPLPPDFGAGQAGLELRGDWRDWRPSRLEGRLWLRQGMVKGESPTPLQSWWVRWPESEARFDGQWLESGWRLQGEAWFGDGKGRVASRPAFELNRTNEGWQGHVHGLRAQDAMAWAAPWLNESARHWLVPLEPRGDLSEITFQTGAGLADYSATVRFQGVASRPVRGLPGFDSIAGILEIGPDQGRITLDSHKVRVDTGGLLRAPIGLDTLSGTVNWRRSTDGLILDSTELTLANPDLNGRFWGSVTLPAAGGPVLDIQGRYWGVQAARAWRYLPVAVIPPKAVAWLDRALVGGRVVAGDLVFRGPPARFPFDGGEGLFETQFRVEDAVVDYMPGWPRLEQGQVAVTFRNRGLRAAAESGRLLDGEVENLLVRIEDLAKAVVQVKGHAKGASASMWRAFEDSPTGLALGENLPALRIEGVSTLDLELVIPLGPQPNQVRGQVGLLGNNVSLPAWTIDLGRLRGEVRFTETDLSASNVQALLRGEPIRIDLDLAGEEGRRELRTRLQGRLDAPALLGESAAVLEPYFTGKSAWDAVLTVPTQSHEKPNRPAFALKLGSDLHGVAVRLPAPLGKVASESRPIKLNLQPSGQGTGLSLALEYGPDTRAVLELGDFPRQPRLERGELRIGAGAAQLPDTPGLTVIAHLPRWSPHIAAGPVGANDSGTKPAKRRTSVPATGTAKTAGFWHVLHAVEARIDDLVIGGRSFSTVTLQAARGKEGLRVELDGKALAGSVTVPDEPTPQQPVNVALQRLHIGRAENDTAQPPVMDPRQLPPLALSVAELRVNDAPLGRLRAIATPAADGVRLTEISLDSDRQRIEASGEWRWAAGGQASRLEATLRSQALGETLAAFGYPGGDIDRGETQAELAVKWAAPFPDFALERLDGALKFQVGPGQLRGINPGLGRMIGMLSVQNLTRRLSFDFSDLFQPGMGFDRISGDFTFQHGQAQTDNFLVEAPAARIEIQGRLGLQTRDFDQTITVVPNFGGTLPVAGTIAGGPVVGAAVFVAERLLQKGIEHATRYRYSLQGTWDKPVVEYLQEPPAVAQSRGFSNDN